MKNGTFLNFNLPFLQNGEFVPSREQAEKILKKATELIANGAQGVAITYSANYGQTRDIEKTYSAGGWNTQIFGANQAEVMYEMELLLGSQYAALQGKMRIVPITTMDGYDDPDGPWNDDLHLEIVTADLARIKTYLENGWTVLGWQNQHTVDNPTHPYAVGGGIAILPQAISDKIQRTLMEYAETYAQ